MQIARLTIMFSGKTLQHFSFGRHCPVPPAGMCLLCCLLSPRTFVIVVGVAVIDYNNSIMQEFHNSKMQDFIMQGIL